VFKHRNATVNLDGNAPINFLLMTAMTEPKQIDQQEIHKVVRGEFLTCMCPFSVEIGDRFVGRLQGRNRSGRPFPYFLNLRLSEKFPGM
jgi:hypothetical protein